MRQKPRGGGLAAAAFADHAQRLAGGDVEADVIDRAHHLAGRAPAARVEMLDEVVRRKDRVAHCLISIAERSPSLSMLNEIEVRKIITPGRAASQGCT
ncbi:NAD(P)-binding protein [Roseicyclus amphidinii]|uniref:NAD(P)-binding protein n=1 Tax=Roseicyclus amphidinii TaxID=3034232 RepID=UPI0032E9FDCF